MYPEFRAYTYFLWAALTVIAIGMYRRCWVHKMPQRSSVLLSAGMIVVALVGARLFHIATNISFYTKYPNQMFVWDTHGLSLPGAGILVGVVGWMIGRRYRLPQAKIADALVPYIGGSIALARVGCFLNGCCFGIVSHVPWAVRFPIASPAHIAQIVAGQTNLLTSLPVHPTQLYEALGALVSIYVARWVKKKRRTNGVGVLVFIASFSLVRLLVHPLRVFPESFAMAPIFPLLYLGIIVLCLVFVLKKSMFSIFHT